MRSGRISDRRPWRAAWRDWRRTVSRSSALPFWPGYGLRSWEQGRAPHLPRSVRPFTLIAASAPRGGTENRGHPPSAHPLAAIDIVGLGNDVFGVLAGEKNRHACEVPRRAHAAIGHRLADKLL